MSEMRVLVFDAGITHVGLVAATISSDWSNVNIASAYCVDITDVKHNRVARDKCTLMHTGSLAHKYAHFVQEFRPAFDEADELWVEQQPPQSAGVVFEQLLHFQFTTRVLSISPHKVHKHFQLPKGDYEGRKRQATKIAIKLFPALQPYIDEAERAHDIADAACMLHYECTRRSKLRRARRRASLFDSVTQLASYAYVPTHCIHCAPKGSAVQTVYNPDECPRCAHGQ